MKTSFFSLLVGLVLTSCALRDDSPTSHALLSHGGDSVLYEHTHFSIPNTTIRALKVVSANEVYFAGSKGKWGYTVDGGENWQVDSIESHEFRSIEVTPNQTIFLVSVQKPTQILRSTNHGKSFTPCLTLPDSMFIDQVHFSNNSNGVAIADPINGYFQIYTTHNGGHTWEKLPDNSQPKALLNEYPFAASNSILTHLHQNIWFCTGGSDQARVHKSTDFGQTWTAYPTPVVSNDKMTGIFAMHMHTKDLGLAAGGNWDSISQPVNNMAITFDGGKSWEELSPNNTLGYISDIGFLPEPNPKRIIAIQGTAKQTESAIYYSPDQGKSWVTYPNPHHYIALRFANKNVAWLSGKNGIGRLEIAD